MTCKTQGVARICFPLGGRITSLVFNGDPLDQKQKYSVVITDFMANGGDGNVFAIHAPQQLVLAKID